MRNFKIYFPNIMIHLNGNLMKYLRKGIKNMQEKF